MSNVTEKNRRRGEPPVRVKRRGKSSPSRLATRGAVRLMGCKVMYISVCRAARPMLRGRPLELAGDGKIR